MQRYDTVLLDADNTLFDFDQAEHLALKLTLEHYGLPFNPVTEGFYVEENKALWARFDRGEITQPVLVVERFRRLLDRLERDGDPEALNDTYLTRLGEQAVLLPGAEAFCRRLLPHCTLALVTNGVARAQRGRLGLSPLRDCFQAVFISEEVGAQKPMTAFFDAVVKGMDLRDRTRAVMVGDTLGSDILGGIRAGFDTIWFNPQGKPGREDILPTRVSTDFEDMANFILGFDV